MYTPIPVPAFVCIRAGTVPFFTSTVMNNLDRFQARFRLVSELP